MAVFQLVVIVVCGAGCLAALISAVCSFIASVRRAIQGMPFLSSVFAPSLDGNAVSLFFGLSQVHHLAEHISTTPQGEEEVQS